MEDSAKK